MTTMTEMMMTTTMMTTKTTIISGIPFILEALDIETLVHQNTLHFGFLYTINISTYQCMTIIITLETITK